MPALENTSPSPAGSPANSYDSYDSGGRQGQSMAPQRNYSRERMKAERELLGKQVVELERELSTLLAKRAVARCRTPSSVWRSLARRQHGRRQRASDENRRLKARLLYQVQVARTLEAVLRNRAGPFLENEEANRSHQSKYPVNDLAALHERCMDEVDQLYLQVDQVFHTASESHDEEPLRRKTMIQGGDEKLLVDLHDTAYAPFSYEKVCNATWRAITTEYARQGRIIKEFCCTDDEYTSKFWMPHVTTAHDDDHHRFSATMTMRKFKEKTRMVLVWHGLDIKETATESSVYSSESGWLVAERAPHPVTGEPCEDATIVRICTRITPIGEGNTEAEHTRDPLIGSQFTETVSHAASSEGDFTKHLLKGTEVDIASITEAIENILLEEAIGSSDENVEAVAGTMPMSPSDLLTAKWPEAGYAEMEEC